MIPKKLCTTRPFTTMLVATILLLCSVDCWANATAVTEESSADDFSWQIMIGTSILYENPIFTGTSQSKVEDLLRVSLLIDLYYKGFFIQSNHRRAESMFAGGEIGYQLQNHDEWALDLLWKTYVPDIIPNDIIKYQGEPIPELAGLDKRTGGSGLGLRYSRFIDDDIFSVDLSNLLSSGELNAWVVDSYYSHLIPYRNWDIYLGAGLTYYNAGVVGNMVGISTHEVTELRAEYHPDGGFRVQFEAFAQYPMAKSWFINTGITQSYYSNAISNSPIIARQHITQAMIGLIYVF